MLVSHGQSTVTLGDSSVTVIDGHMISAARDGSYMVVDGSQTQYVGAKSSTMSSEGEGSGNTREVDDAGRAAIGSGAFALAAFTWRVWFAGILVGFAVV